ncbi:hypothetical protein ACU8KH_06666 [Lachancea thermotolerans]
MTATPDRLCICLTGPCIGDQHASFTLIDKNSISCPGKDHGKLEVRQVRRLGVVEQCCTLTQCFRSIPIFQRHSTKFWEYIRNKTFQIFNGTLINREESDLFITGNVSNQTFVELRP